MGNYTKLIIFATIVIVVAIIAFTYNTQVHAPDAQRMADLDQDFCVQVISYAQNPDTGICEQFSTPCDIPAGYLACEQDPYTGGDVNPEGVVLYYANEKREGDICTDVFEIRKEIPRRYETVEVDTLIALLAPLSDEEKEEGYINSIPEGTRLMSLRISQGTAYADFNETLNVGGGSCINGSIYNQIEKTLLQFPDIDKIVISVNGDTEDVLQP